MSKNSNGSSALTNTRSAKELNTYYNHERNILHQYKVLKELKENINENKVVIFMDLSENYCTMYSEEIQAYHFGGSKLQLSLHTVVVYMKNSTKSYCTVSHNTAHSPAAKGTLEANF